MLLHRAKKKKNWPFWVLTSDNAYNQKSHLHATPAGHASPLISQERSDALCWYDRETSAKNAYRINALGKGTVLTLHACPACQPFMASGIYISEKKCSEPQIMATPQISRYYALHCRGPGHGHCFDVICWIIAAASTPTLSYTCRACMVSSATLSLLPVKLPFTVSSVQSTFSCCCCKHMSMSGNDFVRTIGRPRRSTDPLNSTRIAVAAKAVACLPVSTRRPTTTESLDCAHSRVATITMHSCPCQFVSAQAVHNLFVIICTKGIEAKATFRN